MTDAPPSPIIGPGPAALTAAIEALRAHDPEAALAWASRALVAGGIAPDQGMAVLGSALRAAHRPHAALETLRGATLRFPDHLGVAYQRARAALDLTLLDEARRGFEQCLRLDPDWQPAHEGLGETLMIAGAWDRGWTALRLGASPPPPRVDGVAVWRGEPLAGRPVLVLADQGFGDMLQHSRFLARLARCGAGPVTLLCPPPLHRLLTGVRGTTTVGTGVVRRPGPRWVQIELSRLAEVLAVTPATLEPPPLLTPPAAALDAWRRRLDGLPRPRIGVAWAGRPSHPRDGLRSFPLATLTPLAPRGSFVALTPPPMGLADQEGARLLSLQTPLPAGADFAETAALIGALDAVVSVDTAVAHLAGTLRARTWILIPFACDWRWGRGTEHSPWYPSVTLLRQPFPGDWAAVVADLDARLAAWTPPPPVVG